MRPAAQVLCVPGVGLDAAAWRPTLDGLPQWPSAVAVLPGYGARRRPGEPLDPVALGRRVARERLAGRSGVVLVGHSAGCQVAVEAALAAPGSVAAVVLIGPTTDPRARSWRRLVVRWLRTAAHERLWQVPTLVRSYTRTGPRHLLAALGAARHHDVRAAVRALDRPVLVVRGPRDRICPADWASELASYGAPGSRVVTLAGGAHMVPLTDGPAVAAVLREVLG
ncbi:alpha/beta fold hydrolase [Nocardioides dongkuii]|uniref:alpha/beta fold hydrolase n=1 Tax=Nocardioides dongkuii TaxID=2760089 RepID=UPI0029D4115B|nr:alpha/beta hydrolase [Nocardioides dongkuii]